jgi:hypothetical protein
MPIHQSPKRRLSSDQAGVGGFAGNASMREESFAE